MASIADQIWNLGVAMNAAYADGIRQAALDDKARAIAKLLFEAAGLIALHPGPAIFEGAPYGVQLHYLTIAKAAILSESELIRTRAESRALARVANQAEGEWYRADNGPLDAVFKELLVDAAQAMPKELQRQLVADWGQR